MTRERWLRIVKVVATGGLAIAWAGLLCRGRDGTAVTATLYYATPWLLRLLAGLLAVVTLRHWGFRLLAATCLLLSVMEGGRSLRLDDLPPAPAGALKVSVWNAGRSLDCRPAAWTAFSEADLAAVIETGDFSEEEWQRFTSATPGHEWRRFDGSTMLGVRGKFLAHESLGVHDLFRCHRVRVSLPGHGELTVVVADVRSQPWISRERAIAGIRAAAGDDPAAVIVGDFNTPVDSPWFRPWREQGLTLANDGPRRGFRETWAYGLPFLTIDHVWLGPAWASRRCELSRPGSDHAMVRCVLERK